VLKTGEISFYFFLSNKYLFFVFLNSAARRSVAAWSRLSFILVFRIGINETLLLQHYLFSLEKYLWRWWTAILTMYETMNAFMQ
jgi:hypothetical protein